MRRLRWVLLSLVVFGLWVWLIPSLLYATHSTVVAATFAILPLAALVFVPNRKRTLLVTGGVCVLVFGWWSSLSPPSEADWAPEYARTPRVEFDGNRVTIHDIRNFDYRSETDFTPRWYDATFDLDQLETLDFFKVHWGLPLIAHTMFSFGFADGRYVTVSVETRRQKGQEWSSVAGFFKQYTLTYVLGDERDLVRLRTNFRGEDVYLYPTNTPKDQIRLLFVDILERVNSLADEPEWYNTITDNCTTSLATHVRKLTGRRRWDPRLLINGHTDEMGIESGWITPHGTLEETRAHYYVNPKVEKIEDPSAYSAQIREGLAD
jgi:hypothetical protein